MYRSVFYALPISGLLAVAAPAFAASGSAPEGVSSGSVAADAISSAKRQKYARQRAYNQRRVYSGRPSGWRGADPSLDQSGRPYRPNRYYGGGCVLDLGYGRFRDCNSGT